MIDYGLQQSTVKPKDIDIKETMVFAATDIKAVQEDGTVDQPGFAGYSFNLAGYSKDEYIKMQAEKNKSLEDEVMNTQEALCEIYESMG